MLFRSIAAIALFSVSSVAFAQGKIAVVNLEQAILQTDFAQQQLEELKIIAGKNGGQIGAANEMNELAQRGASNSDGDGGVVREDKNSEGTNIPNQ